MAPSLEESSDPTLSTNGQADEANGPVPEPFERYGKPLPSQWIPLYQEPMRTPTRRVKVVTIGAGVSAMGFAYQLHHAHKLDEYVDHVVYEANKDIGGTWLVNTYPGVACDVPAHVYCFPFEPNPDWTSYYASGGEIQQYFKRTVAKYNLARDVKCGHRVEHAQFDEGGGRWHLRVRHKDQVFEDSCDVLISATGFLSHWRWPSIQGLESFKGHLVHSANWDDKYDFSDKRVGIVGNGSSAIQILPQLASKAAHTTNFVRNPTWITAGLGSGVIGGKINHTYTEEEKKRFREDPEALKQYRKVIQHDSNVNYALFTKGSEAQRTAKESTKQMMLDRLGGDENLASKLTPDWEVGCRRATPGPGYLEAFTRDNVSLVSSSIVSVDETGINTTDGSHHDFDAVVCATGFDVSHRPPWPLIGREGLSLAEAWEDEPLSYLSLAAHGFPNFFMFAGPNSPVGHGSLMAQLQWSADWMCQWIRKIAEEDIKWVDPKQDVVDDFNAYGDEIMQTLVWSGGCRSWYKNHRVDGKVTAVWAGSAIAYHEMIHTIRPEDFDIRYRSRNRFRFMGNGKTKLEFEPDADLAFYVYR